MSTLATIRGNVRRNLQEVTANFFTTSELNQGIGEAYRHYVMIMLSDGEGYFETTTNLGFTANVETVSLAGLTPPYFSLSALERRVSYGTEPMRRYERRYEAMSNLGVTSGDGYIPTYKFRGMNLVLEPTPSSTEAGTSTTGLKLDYNYVPTFPEAGSADNFSFDDGFSIIYEPMIELYATIAALESKDGMGGVSDINSFRLRLKVWEDRFFNSLERDETPDSVDYIGNTYSNPF